MSWANVLSMADCNAAVADLYAFDPKTGHAYTMLILRLRKMGSTPFEDRSLAAIARCTKHFWINRAWPVLQEFFEVRDGRLFHPEIEGLRGMGSYPPETASDRRRQAAQIAANARWGGRSNLNVVADRDLSPGPVNDAPSHAIASQSHTGNDAISSTSAYRSDAIFDANASGPATPGASAMLPDRMPGASGASRAPSLSQQRDSVSEGSKNQTESLGERAPARAGAAMRSDAISDAIASPNASPIASEGAPEPHAAKPGTKPAAPPRRTPIPRDWEPSLEGIAAARKRGLDPGLVAANFRNWHIGNGMTQADWDARFLIWIEREQEQDASRRQGNMPMPIVNPAVHEPEDPAASVAWLREDPDHPALLNRWGQIRADLRRAAPAADWNLLRQMVLNGLDGDEILISLPSAFARDWVRDHWGKRITDLWLAAYPEARRVDFRVNVRAA